MSPLRISRPPVGPGAAAQHVLAQQADRAEPGIDRHHHIRQLQATQAQALAARHQTLDLAGGGVEHRGLAATHTGLRSDVAIDGDIARAGIDHEAQGRAVELAVDVEVPVSRSRDHEFRTVPPLLAVDQFRLWRGQSLEGDVTDPDQTEPDRGRNHVTFHDTPVKSPRRAPYARSLLT